MEHLSPIETLPLLERPQASTILHEEVTADLSLPPVKISPTVADQLVFGCIAIGAIWSVSGLLKQFRLLIEAIDKLDQ